MEDTLDLIRNARKEQLDARARGDLLSEKTWTHAIDELLAKHQEEKDGLNANH